MGKMECALLAAISIKLLNRIIEPDEFATLINDPQAVNTIQLVLFFINAKWVTLIQRTALTNAKRHNISRWKLSHFSFHLSCHALTTRERESG